MRVRTFWKSAGVAVCLGIGLLTARMLWAQEGKFGAQNVQLPVPTKQGEMRMHTAWIEKSLKRLQTIQPGRTRADLMKVCTFEGGLSTGLQRTFVYQECPYIKVDVRFRRADKSRDTDILAELPTDIIAEISRPYLAWSIMD